MKERGHVCVIAGWPIRLPRRCCCCYYYVLVFTLYTIGNVIGIKVKSHIGGGRKEI